MNNVFISVIVTTYNGEKYLAQQLDSILAQTYKNLDIIISDDASTDDTAAIAADYALRDSRIIFYRHDKNIGLHANLEYALKRIRGTYVAISDQDDIWKLDKIEKLLGNIGNHVAIFSDSELIDSKGVALGTTVMQSVKVKDWDSCAMPLNLLFKNVVSGHALLFHKALLDVVLPFREGLIFDHHLAIISSLYGGLAFFPHPLVLHRIHGCNHTNKNIADEKRTSSSSGESKMLRRQRYREVLRVKVDAVRAGCGIGGKALSDLGFDLDKGLVDDLKDIAAKIESFESGFFDVPLFLSLFHMNKKYRYQKALRFKRCFTLSKGDAWYRLAAKFGVR